MNYFIKVKALQNGYIHPGGKDPFDQVYKVGSGKVGAAIFDEVNADLFIKDSRFEKEPVTY